VKRSAAVAVVAVALLAGAGCRRGAAPAGGSDAGARGPLALVEQGRFDEAIAAVGDASDPESLYVLGRAWAGKAAAAPVPPPEPGQSVPPLKAEEARALDFLERAVAARPDLAGAHLAIADLLAPHALALLDAERQRPKGAAFVPTPGPDTSPERVLRSYADAMQADPSGTEAGERLVRFATSAERWPEVDAAYQELVKRRREDPDLLVRYGDFLAVHGGSPERALAQYAQALMWRPGDAATRLKMADIYLSAASEHLSKREYAAAEQRLRDAKRLNFDMASAPGARLRDLEQQLKDIRGR
jgi:tetratricopeptide (TPR) repeat protein